MMQRKLFSKIFIWKNHKDRFKRKKISLHLTSDKSTSPSGRIASLAPIMFGFNSFNIVWKTNLSNFLSQFKHITRYPVPCNSMTFLLPAFKCRLSTFWVTTQLTFCLSSMSFNHLCVKLGWNFENLSTIKFLEVLRGYLYKN